MNLRKDNKKKKPMQLMLDEISGMMGVSQEMILSRMISRNISDSRMLFCYMAYEEGYLFREIASFLKISRCRATTAYYGTEMSLGRLCKTHRNNDEKVYWNKISSSHTSNSQGWKNLSTY